MAYFPSRPFFVSYSFLLSLRNLEQVVTDNSTVASLTKAVDKLCSQLHVSDWCKQNVDPQIPNLLQVDLYFIISFPNLLHLASIGPRCEFPVGSPF